MSGLPPDNINDKAAAPTLDRSVVFQDLFGLRESVFRICLGFSRNYAEAEDLAQDVYVRAYAGWKTFRNPAQSREWLFRIAKNACLDRQKQDRRRATLLRRWAEDAKPNEPADAENLAESRLAGLKSAVRRLPKKLRSVFVLREYGHLSYDEIAVILGVAKGTVMSRLSRARAKIAGMMGEKEP